MLKELNQRDLDGYSIVTGDVFGVDDYSLVLVSDERLSTNPDDDHSYLVRMKGTRCWMIESGWPIRSQVRVSGAEVAILSVGAAGRVRFSSASSGGRDEIDIGTASGVPLRRRTMINEVREVGGEVYAVGTRRAVYVRRGKDAWDAVDRQCYAASNFRCGFSAIDGFSGNEIYAVGRRGEIWQFDGETWLQRDSGTNAALHDVHCMPDGEVMVVGALGTILLGRGDRWVQLSGIDPGYEFWSVACFGSRVFLVANASLTFTLSESMAPTLVDFGECAIPKTANILKSREGALYLFGSKNIRAFDGSVWSDVVTFV